MAEFIGSITQSYKLDAAFLETLLSLTVVILGALILWLILSRILTSVEKKAADNQFIKKSPNLFKIIRRAMTYALILAVGTYATVEFKTPIVQKVFQAWLIIVLATPAKDILMLVLRSLENNIADKTETNLDNIIFELLNRLCGVIIYITAGILALDVLGINVMPFVAGAGVVGIAVGFAAKDTLSNLIAGVLLILDRPFEIGDRIEVWSAPAGSASWGDVIEIGLRATKIQTTDNIVIIIPNNEIMTRDIVNYTANNNKIRVRINIGIAYEADIGVAKEIIIKVARELSWVSADPAPKVVVRNFGASSVDLQARVWINQARKRMDTISTITDRVKYAFDEAGIEIPYPKRDITMRTGDAQTQTTADAPDEAGGTKPE